MSTDCKQPLRAAQPVPVQLALSEAYRNVSATGAEPVAITDGLNFGSPEDPDVMWQFVETILGLVDGCRELGTPVTGGNVSFYNQTGTTNIHPTAIIGMVGVLDDVADRTPSGFASPGDAIVLLGDTGEDLSGGEWASVIHGHVGGMPPMPNLDAERRLSRVLVAASKARFSARRTTVGWWACPGHGRVVPAQQPRRDRRACTTTRRWRCSPRAWPGRWCRFPRTGSPIWRPLHRARRALAAHRHRHGEPQLVVENQFSLPLADIRARWEAPIRNLMVGD